MHKIVVSLILLLALASCGRDASRSVSPEALADAVDSASITVWKPVEAGRDTMRHSAFYDSVLAYVREALPVEAAKREYAQNLIALGPLLPQSMENAAHRKVSLDSLDRYALYSEAWRATIDSLMARYGAFVHKTLDTLYANDASKYQAVLPDLIRRDLFVPAWRARYDSVEAQLIEQTRSILAFVDSNAADIVFDTVLRFRNPDAAAQYALLTTTLDSLSRAEAEIAKSQAVWREPSAEGAVGDSGKGR